MRLHPTNVIGVTLIEFEPFRDARGTFTRIFDSDVFRSGGLDPCVAQSSISINDRADTLRGMHFQAQPHEEGKLVCCTSGRIFDVALDLRPSSESFCHWFGRELSAEDPHAVFIPAGCAHGFQTLEPHSTVHYQMTSPYVPEASRGVRWDDSAFEIVWPDPLSGSRTISERDFSYPDFRP
jgi:dTDP-4-dehydrorhamnose 3,5-epimerase